MQTWSQKLKYGFKNSTYVGLAVLFVLVGLGCANTHKTTKTETVRQSNATTEAGQNTETTITSNDQQNRGVVNNSETTTTTTETRPPGHPGLISSTIHAIGWVIALPFRLVGGLIGWIF